MGKTSFDKIQISLNFKVKVIFHVIFLDKINMERLVVLGLGKGNASMMMMICGCVCNTY